MRFGWVRALAAAVAIPVLLVMAVGGAAAGRASRVDFVPYASGFTAPVYLASAPGDPTTLYVVEQDGMIKVLKDGRITGTFLDIRSIVKCCGERGLLSMAFSPHYTSNHLFYVSYDDLNGN